MTGSGVRAARGCLCEVDANDNSSPESGTTTRVLGVLAADCFLDHPAPRHRDPRKTVHPATGLSIHGDPCVRQRS